MTAGPGAMIPPDDPLTTKEGWRRFVDHHPQPPDALSSQQLATLSENDRVAHDHARRDYHGDLPLVNTPTIRQVLTTGRLLVQLNRRQVSARRGVIVSGTSGTGKTTALTQLGRTHERAVRGRYPDQRYRLPVIYVTVPPAATPRMLAVEFARFLGLEFSHRANITDVVNAVCATGRRRPRRSMFTALADGLDPAGGARGASAWSAPSAPPGGSAGAEADEGGGVVGGGHCVGQGLRGLGSGHQRLVVRHGLVPGGLVRHPGDARHDCARPGLQERRGEP